MNRRNVCIQFKKQLLEYYNNTNDIIKCFYMYLGFIMTHALNDRYKPYTQWQIKDMVMSIYNKKINPIVEVLETAWNYTRRGGKTRGLTVVGTFWAILDKMVIWRSPHSDQLGQCSEWFKMNPFVEKVMIHSNEIRIYGSPTINISVLSPGRVASREADCLIYDEMGWCFKHLQLYEYYKASRPMIAASAFKHILHASTPAKNTVFHEEWESLKELEEKYNSRFTSYHPWRDTHWISKEWVEMERMKNSDCPWYVDQNYEALWVVYGGSVFTDIIVVGDLRYPNYPHGYRVPDQAIHGGVDFNGENVQHYIVTCVYDDKFVHVLKEIKFLNLWDLERYTTDPLTTIELEEGLFNTQFTDQVRRMGLSCIYQEWDEDTKQNRVRELQTRTIIIDKKICPVTYKNLIEAGYDENSRLPKLKKTLTQHGLDALLHCIHDVSGQIYVRKEKGRKVIRGYNLFQQV